MLTHLTYRNINSVRCVMCATVTRLSRLLAHSGLLVCFQVPGGIAGCIFLVTPAVCLSAAVMYFSDWPVWIAGAAQIAASFLFSTACMRLRSVYPRMFLARDLALTLDSGDGLSCNGHGGSEDDALLTLGSNADDGAANGFNRRSAAR